MAVKLGATQQKIILLLYAGLALSLSRSPRKHHRIFRELGREWRKINRSELYRALDRLYQSRLIEERHHSDGSVSIVLNNAGKHEAVRFNLEKMEIRKAGPWDRKWRIVLFDVPERLRKVRDAFRGHLRQLGFYEFQKSVFIHPYDCRKELDFLIEFYKARRFIRFILAEELDNELHLKHHFNLTR